MANPRHHRKLFNDTANASSEEPAEVEVVLYTDGACSGNPGPGGWAFILEHVPSGKILEASGAERMTTNNRMELQAVIEGLTALKRPVRLRLVTDSSYVEMGLREWLHKWKRHGWIRKTGEGAKLVKNVDLWQQLDEHIGRHTLLFERVRGHAGHPQNERCDQMAVEAYKKLLASNGKETNLSSLP